MKHASASGLLACDLQASPSFHKCKRQFVRRFSTLVRAIDTPENILLNQVLASNQVNEYTPKMSPPLPQKKLERIPAEVKREVFLVNGISMKSWAEARGFNPTLVYQILTGRRKCLRGQSHNIARELGMK